MARFAPSCHGNEATTAAAPSNPDVTGPDATGLDVTGPDVTDPDVTESNVTDPDVTESNVTDPDVTDPDATGPDVTDPGCVTARPIREDTARMKETVGKRSHRHRDIVHPPAAGYPTTEDPWCEVADRADIYSGQWALGSASGRNSPNSWQVWQGQVESWEHGER